MDNLSIELPIYPYVFRLHYGILNSIAYNLDCFGAWVYSAVLCLSDITTLYYAVN